MNELVEMGNVKGYLAKPTGDGPWPAVIVIQEDRIHRRPVCEHRLSGLRPGPVSW